jgi:hypothetical protein
VLPGSFDRVHGRWAFAESPASPAGHL